MYPAKILRACWTCSWIITRFLTSEYLKIIWWTHLCHIFTRTIKRHLDSFLDFNLFLDFLQFICLCYSLVLFGNNNHIININFTLLKIKKLQSSTNTCEEKHYIAKFVTKIIQTYMIDHRIHKCCSDENENIKNCCTDSWCLL